VLTRRRGRREVSSVVLLTAPLDGQPARLFARHVVGTIRTPELLRALRYFHAKLGRRVILVWDHARVHRAQAVRSFVAAHPTWYRIEWLPGYAPELNPEEQCNGAVKRAMLNALSDSPEQLRRLARRHFAALGRRPEALRGCFVHAGLNLT
jgi:transposase